MRGTLLRAAISLALVSIILSIIMFRLNSPLAAVFELSVCAGFITVLFMSVISLTKPFNYYENIEMTKGRIKRFWYLPVLVIVFCAGLYILNMPVHFMAPKVASAINTRTVLWSLRQFDMFGQVVILLLGVFGIVILIKTKSDDQE
jgi:NADH-quinone oxidoreductase subunit J